MKEDSFQCRRLVSLPSRTGLPLVVEFVAMNDRRSAKTTHAQFSHERVERVVRADAPMVANVVTPRLVNRLPFESPFKPSHFDVRQVLD
jgi:hypothetical protein